MDIGYIITVPELMMLLAISKTAEGDAYRIPTCEMTPELMEQALRGLEKKGYISVGTGGQVPCLDGTEGQVPCLDKTGAQETSYEMDPVMLGLMKIISTAGEVRVSEGQQSVLYVHEVFPLYLRKEPRSKQTYILIPYRNQEAFYDSPEGARFREDETHA